MFCPYCKGRTLVKDSKAIAGHVYRRRRCQECGALFYTEEVENPTAKYPLWQLRHEFKRQKEDAKKGKA